MFYPLHHIDKAALPKEFTYPFYYQPHPLCVKAAKALQTKLNEWNWDNINQGKMFGVLLVENSNGNIGYLWAYSGNRDNKLDASAFVPPIFDVTDDKNFFLSGEAEITAINKQIKIHESSSKMQQAKALVIETGKNLKEKVNQAKTANKASKKERQKQRSEAKSTLTPEEFQPIKETLDQQSMRERSALKQLKTKLTNEHQLALEQLKKLQTDIDELKNERKTKSYNLQQRLFQQYQLLNANQEIQDINHIFEAFNNSTPPAASGDCAAPRLLQYAYQNKMQPLAMAEFWWGKSPVSILRKQGNYYPACRNKCEPILGHMLQGLLVENNPLANNTTKPLTTVYEDEWLLVVNKPSGMLSVPGKHNSQNVLHTIQEMRPDLQELYVVHRIDMATSGLLILAKTTDVYKNMQARFAARKVKKKYIALLDGELKSNYGKIELPLRVDLDNRPQQMVCYQYGKPALTVYKVQKIENGKTRIAFFPITGRSHQLRVHAAHTKGLNMPIIGDDLYGKPANRLHLHAAQIEFEHPVTQKKMNIESKEPF